MDARPIVRPLRPGLFRGKSFLSTKPPLPSAHTESANEVKNIPTANTNEKHATNNLYFPVVIVLLPFYFIFLSFYIRLQAALTLPFPEERL